MTLLRQYFLFGFSITWLRMVGMLTLFVLFYSMLRLQLKGEQLEWVNILWFTFYSFSEVLPFLTAIALVTFLKNSKKSHEIELLELYSTSKKPHVLMLSPIMFFLTGVLSLYLFLLKPHFKEEFKSGRLLLASGSEEAIPVQGGYLWMKEGFRWVHNRADRVLILKSDSFSSIDRSGSHSLGKGDLKSLGRDRLFEIEFDTGDWNHGGLERGVRTMGIRSLLKAGHWFEIMFRLNSIVLLWILAFFSWGLGRSSVGGVFLPMGGVFMQYLLVYHILRPLGSGGDWVVLALLPSLSLLVWFPWLRRSRV